MNPTIRQSARLLLFLTAITATVILGWRAAIGPLDFWGHRLSVYSPLTTESVFWIAICGLLFTQGSANVFPGRGLFQHPRIALALSLCLIALAFAGNLADPFLSDDYIIVSRAHWNGPALLAAFHTPGGDGAFRPLGTLYYQLAGTWAGFNSLKWHLCALALHLLNSALVFSLAFRLWRDTFAAASSALVFGLHGTRPEVVVWTAGNFDLLACLFVLAAINLALTTGVHRRGLILAAALLLLVAGILCKESAYAAPFLTFGLLLSNRDRRDLRHFLIGSVGVCVALFAYRWYLFHGPGGYLDSGTGRPSILALQPVTAIKGLFLRIWAILLLPFNWDTAISAFTALALIASMTGLILLLTMVKTTALHSRRIRIGLLVATLGSVLPAIHLVLLGQSGLGSRILYLSGMPFALLIGSLALFGSKRGIALSALFLLGSLGILEHNLGAWHRVALRARELCVTVAGQASRSAKLSAPATLDGVYFFRNGFPECVARERSVASAREHIDGDVLSHSTR